MASDLLQRDAYRLAYFGIGVALGSTFLDRATVNVLEDDGIRQGVVAGDVATKDTSPDAVVNMITGETLAAAGAAG